MTLNNSGFNRESLEMFGHVVTAILYRSMMIYPVTPTYCFFVWLVIGFLIFVAFLNSHDSRFWFVREFDSKCLILFPL